MHKMENNVSRVLYTDALHEELAKALEEIDASGVFVLTDRNVEPLVESLAAVAEAPRFVLEPGEQSKSLESAAKLWSWLGDQGATRRSVLVNIGGGVVSDLGGFVAATFKRGMRFINVPTTLLAAADAAIGGKTGIDFNGLKNEVGTFAMPERVIVSAAPLATLPRREVLSGFAEVIKMALLTDAALYRELLEGDALTDSSLMGRALRNAAMQKERVVAADPKEKGLRRILNLGHTAGHAYEMLTARAGTPITHGEAVAHGIHTAMRLSEKYAGLDPAVIRDYKARILDRYYTPLPSAADAPRALLRLMAHDKKNPDAKSISFVLLAAPGHPIESTLLPPETVSLFL